MLRGYLIQFSWSFLQSILHRKRSQASQPIGGVNAAKQTRHLLPDELAHDVICTLNRNSKWHRMTNAVCYPTTNVESSITYLIHCWGRRQLYERRSDVRRKAPEECTRRNGTWSITACLYSPTVKPPIIHVSYPSVSTVDELEQSHLKVRNNSTVIWWSGL